MQFLKKCLPLWDCIFLGDMHFKQTEDTRRGGYVAPFFWELDLFESREILDGSIETGGGNPEGFGDEEVDDSGNWS